MRPGSPKEWAGVITHLELHRFKCFKELKLDLARINIFIGRNGTGKSSVLQALACLRQSLGSNSLQARGNLVDLGEFRDLSFGLKPLGTIGMLLHGARRLEYADAIGFSGESKVHYQYRAIFGPQRLLHHEWRNSADSLEMKTTKPEEGAAVRVDFPEGTVFVEGLTQALVGQPIKIVAVQVRDTVKDPVARKTAEDFVSLAHREIEAIGMVPPLRGFVKPELSLGSAPLKNIQAGAPHDALAAGIATTMALEESLDDQVSSWLTRVTGVGFWARPREQHQVRVAIDRGEIRVNVVNDGFGTNQLTWLLAVLALAEEQGIVMIEEPEVHLHPKAQANLMSVLVETASPAQKDLQLLMTTHSEHILYRALTLVAQGELAAQDVAVYEFDLDAERVGHAERLEVTENGQIKGGLKGFFDVTLEQMDDYMKALLAKGRK